MSKNAISFSITASIYCILFFVIANISVNHMAGSNTIWFVYPIFAILWWPMTMILLSKGKIKVYSAVSGLLIVLFLIITNYITSPDHPWFLYAGFPAIWWPIVMFAGRKAKTLKFSIVGSISVILYYAVLNFFISPTYPWVIFIIYAVLWWPISMYFPMRKMYFEYSVVGSTLSVIFFVVTNYFSSPTIIWAVYPTFGVMWWVLAVYYFQYKKIKSI